MSNDFDDQGFLASFPCYVLLEPPFRSDDVTNGLIVDNKTRFRSAKVGNDVYILAFTDSELAERFLFDERLCGRLLILELPAHDDLERMLKMIKTAGGLEMGVLFDASRSNYRWRVPYSEIVRG